VVEENLSPSMRNQRRARAGCCAFALAALCLFAPKHALAMSPTAIPPECGSRANFDSELRKRLGEDAPVGSVHVAIEQRARGYHLRVQIGSELRELEDENCGELLRAAVVVAVAVLLHEREATATAPSPAPSSAPPSARSGERPRFTLAAGAGLCAGTLPPPVLGLELESKLLFRHWGFGLTLRYLTPGEQRDPNDRGVRLQAFGAGAFGLFRPSHSWEARVGFATQYLFGEGFGEGVPTFESRRGAAWAAGPTLGLAFIPLVRPPLWAGLGAEGQLNLVRGNFQIRNYSEHIYDVPRLAGSGFVRLGLTF
jgi:hypothetical protein